MREGPNENKMSHRANEDKSSQLGQPGVTERFAVGSIAWLDLEKRKYALFWLKFRAGRARDSLSASVLLEEARHLEELLAERPCDTRAYAS